MRGLRALFRLRPLAALVCGVLLVSGCSIYDAPLPGGPSEGNNPMTVTVMFRDVLDLVPQSTVKVNDVTVGKVTKVALQGYVAKVTITLPRTVDLPDNAQATIRQTSLLGEKFVSLAPPSNPSSNKLSNGDVIGLDHTGRNPEVEEVFGALALLLNGGGVGQLKTIAAELNNAFGGRESDVRSVLDQIRTFMTTLDNNKSTVVSALENTDRLAAELRKQDSTIKATLDDVPGALASVNRQRDDLVRLLKSLTRLSGIGVKVIQASKTSTINSLRELAPVLNGFAQAGQSFPKSFQVFLTYPFVDEAVGRDPQVARNLHMGDYTNLSVNLDLSLLKPLLPSLPPIPTPACDLTKKVKTELDKQLGGLPLPTQQYTQVVTTAAAQLSCSSSAAQIASAVATALAGVLNALPQNVIGQLCGNASTNPLCTALKAPGPLSPTSIPGVGQLLQNGTSSGGGLGLPRAQLGSGYQVPQPIDPFGLAAKGYDPGVGTILFEGVATHR